MECIDVFGSDDDTSVAVGGKVLLFDELYSIRVQHQPRQNHGYAKKGSAFPGDSFVGEYTIHFRYGSARFYTEDSKYYNKQELCRRIFLYTMY